MKAILTLEEIAKLTASTLVGDFHHEISGVADLESATPAEATFLANAKYAKLLETSQAGVIFIDEHTARVEGKNYLISENPSSAFQKVVEHFFKDRSVFSEFERIHPSSVIHEKAVLGPNVRVGPNAVIDAHVSIGEGTAIGACTVIGPGVQVGKNCYIYSNVTIREHCCLGDRVVIQPGAVIGSCGFGYITDSQGNHVKLKQVGNVSIEDDVEIGANVCIDRARFQTTRIGKGSKIDNLVQIAHGVQIGKGNIIVAQTGIAGSSKTGKYVILAGQTAIAGHLTLADGVILAGKSGVSKSLLKAGKYGGVPAQPLQEHNKSLVLIRRLGQLFERVSKLEESLK